MLVKEISVLAHLHPVELRAEFDVTLRSLHHGAVLLLVPALALIHVLHARE